MTTDQQKPSSRLGKHLQIIGAEKGSFTEPELEFERSGIGSMNPPSLKLDQIRPLKIPEKRVAKFTYGRMSAIGVGLAAMIAVIVFSPKEDDGFRVKGAGQVQVFADFEGSVTSWDKLSKLNNGTKLRIEIKAFDDVTAVVGVVDRNFNDLFSAETVWDKKIQIQKGDVGLSSGSIELTGEDEGEILITAVCATAQFPADLASFRDLWVDVKSAFLKKPSMKVNVAGCQTEAISLR